MKRSERLFQFAGIALLIVASVRPVSAECAWVWWAKEAAKPSDETVPTASVR
jgi:hypothetical protein